VFEIILTPPSKTKQKGTLKRSSMNSNVKHKFPRRRKGFSLRAGTGEYYRWNSVHPNLKVVRQKLREASTTVEDDVSSVETCAEPECPISSPKKIRRGKREKVPMSNQKKEPEVPKNNDSVVEVA
jgi:hypothetical protein